MGMYGAISSKILSYNIEYMGQHPHLQQNLRNDQALRADMERISSSHSSQRLKRQDGSKSEHSVNRSYACPHSKIEKNIDNDISVPPKWACLKAQNGERTTTESELVKYMSNLPCYLQRVDKGENLQDKALNFGVLDWGLLENWKHNQKHMPVTVTASTSSTINSSVQVSNVGSSKPFSRCASETSSHHRKQSTTLYSHLTSTSRESHLQGDKPSRETTKISQDLKPFSQRSLVSQGRILRNNHLPGIKQSDAQVENPRRKDSDPVIMSDLETSSSSLENYKVSLCSKVKVKGGKVESTNITESYCEYRLPDQQCPGKQKTIILLLPKNSSKNSSIGISQQFESSMAYDQRSTEANHQSFQARSCASQEFEFTKVHSDIPHSCPLPSSFESSRSDAKSNSSEDARGGRIPFDASHSGSDAIPKELSYVFRPSKGRCLSPTYSFNIASGQMKRGLSSEEVPAVPHLQPTYVAVKSGPAGSVDMMFMDKSGGESKRANSRGRSSPLKRLLDPLLKPRAINRRHSHESLRDESLLTHADNVWKSSEETLDSSKVTPVKRNLCLSSSNPTCTNGSDHAAKHEMVQALVKVTVKDGLQTLAFAVDSNSNILVATMKKTTMSGKYDCSWIYTFYSFHKLKKKSGGWINQGSKGNNHNYAPKVVGQMKVSGSQYPESAKHSSKDPYIFREFVLFGIEQSQPSKKVEDFETHNELAAIVVKVPKNTCGDLSGDGWFGANYKNVAEAEFSECFIDEKGSSTSEKNPQNELYRGSQCLSSPIVILPGGVHGLPTKGIPSPLIKRWRSGGSCDCGGWDMGCNLRILACEDQSSNNCSSSEALSQADHFVLSFEGGTTQERIPAFMLGAPSGGICSLSFNASISSIQAFSICAALLHCTKLAELSEVSNLIEDKVSQDFMSTTNSRTKIPIEVEPDVPPTYIPFPPLSPVGRV